VAHPKKIINLKKPAESPQFIFRLCSFAHQIRPFRTQGQVISQRLNLVRRNCQTGPIRSAVDVKKSRMVIKSKYINEIMFYRGDFQSILFLAELHQFYIE
jgi:hypothetical protein